jgi:hypothetical protein
MKVRLLTLLSVIFALALFLGAGRTPIAAQEPEPTETPPPGTTELPPIPDDIMPFVEPVEQDQSNLTTAATDYKVIPIWFVPNDVTPNPLALPYIDNHMQLIQRWYGEQMRDVTFTLEPTRIVVGSYSLAEYYGPCFPPAVSSCSWPGELFYNTFDDLHYNLGYPYQSNRVLEVFVQHEGIGGAGLGGGNRALIDLNRNNTFGDCLYIGCGLRVNDEGGAAHELGHAFGLPHTSPDSENSDSRSLMLFGFYSFPRANLANTSINPERDMLRASPFFNLPLTLKNGGFEHQDCLFAWTHPAGAASCTTTVQRSGLSALQLLPHNSQAYTVSQKITASAGQTYDFSGWLNIGAPAATGLKIRVQALAASNAVLSTFEAANYTTVTNDWKRFGLSATMPPNTTQARIQIVAPGFGPTIYVDNLDFQVVQAVPPAPSPVFHSEGDAVPTLHPLLQWAEVPAATSFRIQVAADSNFNSLISDAVVSSLSYLVPDGLAYDRRYFWRVRANNGVGPSDWSVTWSFVPRSADNYYNEEFEAETLASAWSWVREDSSNWWFGGPLNRRGNGYLGITAQAGDLAQGSNSAKNLLLRHSPPGDFEVSTEVEFYEPLNTNYQQGGLFIYQDDDNYLKLVRTYSNSFRIQWQAEINGTLVEQASTPINSPVLMKIARLGNSYTGYYSPDGLTWRQLGQPITVSWPNPRMGLGAYNPLGSNLVTAYFEHFRVRTSNIIIDHKTFLPLILK